MVAVPLTVYVIGVYRTLAAADRTGNGPWPMMFLYGAVMIAATVGLQETLYPMLALHGGSMQIESRLGEGTRVTIFLPIDCESARRQEADRRCQLETMDASDNLVKKRA